MKAAPGEVELVLVSLASEMRFLIAALGLLLRLPTQSLAVHGT